MTDFLAGLLARAQDGAPALPRRRPSLFETPAQPAAMADDPFGAGERRTLGTQDPDEEWDGLLDETTIVEPLRPADAMGGAPGPARMRRSRHPAQHPGDADPSPGPWGDEEAVEREPGIPAAPLSAWRKRTSGTPAADAGERPAPAVPGAAAPTRAASFTGTRIRSIETIAEPASGRPPAPLLPQASSPATRAPGLERPSAAIALAPDSGYTPPRAEPIRLRPEQLQEGLQPAFGELDEMAPVRPLRRPSPGAVDARGRTVARRDVPAAPPAPPAIHVTIGRIEVRATPARTPAPVQAPRPSGPKGPKLGLDEYLRSRSGRRG